MPDNTDDDNYNKKKLTNRKKNRTKEISDVFLFN